MKEATQRPPSPLPSLGTILQESWQRFLRLGSRLVAIAVLGGVASFLVEYLFDASAALETLRGGAFFSLDGADGANTVRAEFAMTFASFVIDTITLRAMFLLLRTPTMSTRTLVRTTTGRFLPFFAVNVLVTVLVVAGLFAFIIPGILLLLTFILAPAIAIWEDTSILGALRRSVTLTQGVRFRILAVGIVASLITGSLGLLLSTIPYLASFTQMALMVPFLTAITATLYTLLARPRTA